MRRRIVKTKFYEIIKRNHKTKRMGVTLDEKLVWKTYHILYIKVKIDSVSFVKLRNYLMVRLMHCNFALYSNI